MSAISQRRTSRPAHDCPECGDELLFWGEALVCPNCAHIGLGERREQQPAVILTGAVGASDVHGDDDFLTPAG